MTLVETYWSVELYWRSSSRITSFESPKSATLALKLLSRRMLLALMSRWKMGGFDPVWRYNMPRAVPNAMCKRLEKSSVSVAVTNDQQPCIVGELLQYKILKLLA